MVRYVLKREIGYLESLISEKNLLDVISLKSNQALKELKSTKNFLLNIIDENEDFDFEIIEDEILVRGLTAIISCELNNQPPLNKKDEILDKLYSALSDIIKSDIILNLQFKVLDQLDVKVPRNYLNIPYLKDLLITGKIAKLILSELHSYDEFKAILEVLDNDIKDNEVFSLPHFIIYIYSIKDKQLNDELPSYKINTNIMKLKYTKSNKIDNYEERKMIVDHISECQIFFKLLQVLYDLEVKNKEFMYENKILIVYLFNSFSPLIEVKSISNILSNNIYSGAEYLSKNIKLENEYDEVYQKYLNKKYDLKNGNVLFPSNFYTSKNFLFKFYLAETFSSLIVFLPNLIEFYDELINKSILEIEKNFKSKKNEQLNGKEILFSEEYLSKIFNFIFNDEIVSGFLNMKSRNWNKEQTIITCCYKEAYKAKNKKAI